MHVVDDLRIYGGKTAREEVRLLLIIALDADAVARTNDAL